MLTTEHFLSIINNLNENLKIFGSYDLKGELIYYPIYFERQLICPDYWVSLYNTKYSREVLRAYYTGNDLTKFIMKVNFINAA